MNTNSKTFQNLLQPTYSIGPLLGRSPLVWGPRVQKWYAQDHALESQNHRKLIERLQAAHAKWPQWLRGGGGLSEAELDACKELASMSPQERRRILSIRFAPE